MGIVNVTPDSFSDGGQYLDADRAIAHGLELVAEGAEILDVGGESTRPGAEPVALEEELARVIPVIEGLAQSQSSTAGEGLSAAPRFQISIDTSKLEVAEAALAAGAEIVNDVTAMRNAPGIAALCAERGADLIVMHMRGTPKTMQDDPRYEDVVAEVRDFLAERAAVATAAGVPPQRISIDPGIGFGKTADHNLELLARLDEIAALGYRVTIGTSRKRFIAKVQADAATNTAVGSAEGPAAGAFPPSPSAQERLGGTIASGLAAWRGGASILRVHEVAPMRQALAVATAIDRVA